jgi:hypothetical protein
MRVHLVKRALGSKSGNVHADHCCSLTAPGFTVTLLVLSDQDQPKDISDDREYGPLSCIQHSCSQL